MNADRKMNETRLRLHEAIAHLDYHLEIFGDHLAEKQGYKDLDGMEAIRLYLCLKHHWTPATVRAMTGEDIRFMLHKEMEGWTMPDEAKIK